MHMTKKMEKHVLRLSVRVYFNKVLNAIKPPPNLELHWRLRSAAFEIVNLKVQLENKHWKSENIVPVGLIMLLQTLSKHCCLFKVRSRRTPPR